MPSRLCSPGSEWGLLCPLPQPGDSQPEVRTMERVIKDSDKVG